MTKQTTQIILFLALAAVTAGLAGCCGMCKSCHQVIIITQPEDQTVAATSNATFTVVAVKGPPFTTNGVVYQWQENHTPNIAPGSTNWVDIGGATNFSYTVAGLPAAVGFYRVLVSGSGPVKSDAASLSVFGAGGGGGMLPPLYGPPQGTAGNSGTPCPGGYAGFVLYKKTVANGWGWAPTPGASPHIASDGTMRTDTKVEMSGSSGSPLCSTSPNSQPTLSALKYRFTIYFPNNVPQTNRYPLNLTNFDP